jgi:hypothetical protein
MIFVDSALPLIPLINLLVLAYYRESLYKPWYNQEILVGAYSPDLIISEVKKI